ncbi:MAG: hypothetical protein RBR08_11035 [Desulforegulaceae bacterium]|nr:hypothetical protein [Desulforegulaceae bacterium]
MKSLFFPVFFSVVIFFALFSSCSGLNGSKSLKLKVSPVELIENPLGYEGKNVILSGSFRGWRCSKMLSSPPVSRSDWMIEEKGKCIYVHGAVPENLSPLKPGGEPVTVRGVVFLKKGVPYLDLDERGK